MIGIPTFKRPERLRKLLGALCQIVPSDVEIVVVDNDACLRQGEQVCSGFARVTHRVEPARGVSHARNRLIEYALLSRQDLIFLDDDQIPSEDWWETLCSVHSQHPDAVIAGHVEFTVPSDAVSEVKHYFAHTRKHADGASLKTTGAGNVLIPFTVLQQNRDVRFALEMNDLGGEDTLFFSRLRLRGIDIIWSTKAFVIEPLPVHRATESYIRKRSVNSGLIRATIQTLNGAPKVLVVMAGCCRVFVGGATYILASLMSLKKVRRRARLLYWSGLGFTRVIGRRSQGREWT